MQKPSAFKVFMKKSIFIIVFLLLICTNAFAGLSITPARSEVVIEQNGTYDSFYTIKNGFDKTVRVEISVKNWNNSLENRNVPVTNWLIIPYNYVVLEPGESRQINYTVKSGNLKGSLSGMVSFTVRSPDHEGINLMTSVPVYMTVDGTQNISYDIESIGLKKNNDDNITINYAVKNSGNVHLRLNGNLKVTKGKNVAAERIINDLSPVYPDLARSFSNSIAALPKGKYILNISLSALNKTAEKSIQFRVNKYGDISY